MNTRILAIVLITILIASSASMGAVACDRETGLRKQRVFLTWDGASVKDWTVTSDAIEAVDLPNGFHLGVKIEPATQDKYAKEANSKPYVPELVKITLVNLGDPKQPILTHTWGGANSIQGYAASGGADRVEALGTPGVELTLLKPVCTETHSAPTAN